MSANWKTLFSLEWTDKKLCPEFASWVQPVSNDVNSARCIWCRTTVNLSNMGRTALLSHMKGSKHIKNGKLFHDSSATVSTITQFMNSLRQPTTNVASTTSSDSTSTITAAVATSDAETPSGTITTDSELLNTARTGTSLSSEITTSASSKGRLSAFIARDNVTNAEILWALKVVKSHYSFRSSTDMKQLFEAMFTDSTIAKQMSVGKTKVAYIVTCGLAPFFHRSIVDSVKNTDEFTACFDEALNKIAQRGQMDMHVRYWDTSKNVVVSRYLTSTFMNRATANDIVEKFSSALREVPCEKMLQVSMDGPNVNWKFF